MKLINNKNCFTLIELIISILISTILFFIVFTFIANSIEDLTKSNFKTVTFNQIFSFRDNLNRTIRWWYMMMDIIWTWSENNVIYLKNAEGSEWFVFWVVNRETMKIQKNYIYWDNTIWYRKLSQTEVNNINTSSWEVYNLTFMQDKIYDWLIIKDFKAEFYNSWTVLDLNISSILFYNDSMIWESLTGTIIKPEDTVQFNLDF